MPSYDIFIATAAADSAEAQATATALQEQDLRVFIDDGTEGDHDVHPALLESRLMVPYYSQRFPKEPHCQQALLTAFLAGHRSGNPLRYVAAINPDDPTSSHIVPMEIADAKYVTPAIGLDGIARAIRTKVSKNTDAIGSVPPVPAPWINRPTGQLPALSTNQIASLWDLHTKLVQHNFPLHMEAVSRGIVTIAGPIGIGRTTLAANYAELFSAQYQGGIYYINLDDRGVADKPILDQYSDKLNDTACSLGITDIDRETLVPSLAEHLNAQPEPSLWIVDDVPNSFDANLINKLIIPAHNIHTVLISNWQLFRTFVPDIALHRP